MQRTGKAKLLGGPKKIVTYCAGCGKPIAPWTSRKEPGDQTIDIRIGSILADTSKLAAAPKDGFRPKSNWGKMHLTCFLRSMESSDEALATLGIT